jgi:hypothetical protein
MGCSGTRPAACSSNRNSVSCTNWQHCCGTAVPVTQRQPTTWKTHWCHVASTGTFELPTDRQPHTGSPNDRTATDHLANPLTNPCLSDWHMAPAHIWAPTPHQCAHVQHNQATTTPKSGVHVPKSGVHVPKRGVHVPKSGVHVPKSGVQRPNQHGVVHMTRHIAACTHRQDGGRR